MKIVFMGSPDFACQALDALIASEHEVLAVYTQPPRPAHRGKALSPSAVHRLAQSHGIEVRTPLHFKDAEDVAAFKALKADINIVAAYGIILPQEILSATPHGALNIHASLLPRWRGAAPIHRAIMAGDHETGISIMQMEAGLDTGPVRLMKTLEIGAEETTGELHDRLARLGAQTLLEALSKLDQLPAREQPEEGVCYAAKIDKSEARIDWRQSAEEIARNIRGLSPFPGAWTMLQNQRVKCLNARAIAGTGPRGHISQGLKVACGHGCVEITRAQRAGKSAQNADDFFRGLDLSECDRFT